jgi:hypothetical protein
MAKYFVFKFMDKNISARALLHEKAAPQTCKILWDLAPFKGDAGHAIFSGTTAALLIDPSIVIPMENATTQIQTRDVMFTHYDPMQRHGYPDALSEIYWAYDRYCRPTMPGAMLPVYPNIFGEFVDGYEEFFAESRRIPTEGQKKITITPMTG